MAFSVTMPALGESVSEGTVTRWLKREGETVQADEPLLEVSTDKVDTEIPSPTSGVIQRILVSEDQTVSVGAELAVIGDAAEQSSGGSPQADSSQQQSPEQQSAEQNSPQQPAEPPHGEPGVGEGTAPYGGAPGDLSTSQAVESPSPASSSEGGDAQGTPVVMPALGESVSEGTVTRWLKSVGDRVEVDEPLLEVSTDKVDTELPSPVAGTLLRIDVEADATVSVGAQLAVIGDASSSGNAPPTAQSPAQSPAAAQPAAAASAQQSTDASPSAPSASQPPAPSAASAPSTPSTPSAPPSTSWTPPASPGGTSSSNGSEAGKGSDSGESAYVTPLVRRLAAEQGVDLSQVTGTGVGGRIRKQDVLEAASRSSRGGQSDRQSAPSASPSGGAPAAPAAASSTQPAPLAEAPQRGTREKMSRLRKVIASRMVESLQTSAQLTTVVEVDLSRIAALRAKAKREFEAREGVKLSYLPFLAKATVEALKAHAVVNASIVDDEIVYHEAEHLGIAVDTERGLLVPVIHNAGELNIAGLAKRIADLAERTRSNRITPDELGGGTFTLTNTGSRGALFDTPILNQPQVGILGTGTVVKRPVVVPTDLGDTIAIRSMMYLALSYDHRLVDGADAARFLTTVKSRLEDGGFAGDLGL